ncbi:G5 domain-containing protein [Neobacillus soli]|uniref:G5 domain-containing protein n=1 Tax=Neobacillus soli TaxID=220688 RepID=UPI0008255584|nr:G5 domain-containing protein [Neobacillus soli]
MGKNQQFIKLFVVLFLSTAFIFSFSNYGAKAFKKITNANGKFSDGTTIGALDVSGKTGDEALSLLEEKYVTWLKDTSIELQYGGKTAPFDLNLFHLDAKQTVDSIKDGQKNIAYFTVDKSKVEEQIQILFPQVKSSDLDLDKLATSLNGTAALFESGSQTLNLFNDFLLADHIKKDAVLNKAVVELKDIPFELPSLIERNPRIEISAESTFSLLEFAKKQKITDASTLNLLATGIYQAVLPSNFSIVERNIGSSLPDYASLGFEAKVNPIKKVDLVLVNPNKAKYILELQLQSNKLKVTLKGEKFVYNYEITSKDEQRLKPKTIVQYSPMLLPGKTMVQTKGAEGQIVKIYREVYQENQLLKRELISEDYYPPVYKVEVHGLAGNQQGTVLTPDTAGNQTGTTTDTTTTDANSQTTTTPDTTQPESSDSDLWGKPNEQPK